MTTIQMHGTVPRAARGRVSEPWYGTHAVAVADYTDTEDAIAAADAACNCRWTAPDGRVGWYRATRTVNYRPGTIIVQMAPYPDNYRPADDPRNAQ